MQQGQADILIARFPDPNYGVKTINFMITSLTYRELSVGSSLRYSEVSLVHVRSSKRKSLLRQNERNLIWISKTRSNVTFGVKYPCQNIKGWGVFRILQMETSFWNFDYANVTGVQWMS